MAGVAVCAMSDDTDKEGPHLDPIGRAFLKALSSFQSYHGLEVTYKAPPTPPAPRSLPTPAQDSQQNGAAESPHARQQRVAGQNAPNITVAYSDKAAGPMPAHALEGFDPTIGVPGPWVPARTQQATPSPATGEQHGDPSSSPADTSTPYNAHGYQQHPASSWGYSYPYNYHEQYQYPYWGMPPPPPPPPPPPLLPGAYGQLPSSGCIHCAWPGTQHNAGLQPLAAAAAAATGSAGGGLVSQGDLAGAAAAVGGNSSLPIPQELQQHAQSLSDATAASARALAVGGSEAAAKLLMTWYYAGYHSGASLPAAGHADDHMAVLDGQH